MAEKRTGHGKGRLVVPKLRQLIPDKYKLNPLRNADGLPVRKSWYAPGILNQGNYPHCVAFAAKKLVEAGPQTNKFPWTTKQFYDLCQKADEWPGENYDGTSVRAAMTVLRDRGIFSAFEWAFDHGTALKHMLLVGPMNFGTSWYEGMEEVDDLGYIRVEGKDLGGHSYLCATANRAAYDRKTETYGAWTISNSWGERWANGGRAKITFGDMEKLIENWGEAAIGTEVKIRNEYISQV